jgi:drug/metabolite transporter (DMT)-like permease
VFVFIQIFTQTVAAFLYAFIGEKLLLAGENIFAFTFEALPLMTVAVVGVVATGICWTLRAHCLKNIPVMVASVVMPLSTVLTVVWSIAGGMEEFTWNLLIGGVIVISAIFIAKIEGKPKEAKQQKQERGSDKAYAKRMGCVACGYIYSSARCALLLPGTIHR